MPVIGRIIKGAYYDSVTLMRVSGNMSQSKDVQEVSIVMGTQANLSILESSDMLLPEFQNTGDADLIIAVRLENPEKGSEILDQLAESLNDSVKTKASQSEYCPVSIEGAIEIMPEANLALISVAGKYAGSLAMEALVKGLHVMIFSDNVPVETELSLKKYAKDHGLLVMGPDCGTAIINGIPLGFANAVNKGNIGIVAASGTGLQEISTIISSEGCGISQAIGTGGHDLKDEIGGIMFIEGIKALADDPETKVIVLVSKPPDIAVMTKIENVIGNVKKPVVSFFIGVPHVENAPRTLDETALFAVAQAKDLDMDSIRRRIQQDQSSIEKIAEKLNSDYSFSGQYIRGLFSGGTFCSEAQILFKQEIPEIYSNIPIEGAKKLSDPLVSVGHTVIDLGDDIFTMGRPHPMIDFSLRRKRILTEAQDPETAVILLDIVLGYGSNDDPAGELVETIKNVSGKIPVICSVTGTDLDFQNKKLTIKRLEEAGAIVMNSNAAACRLTSAVISSIKR